jgi:hypothetical protein
MKNLLIEHVDLHTGVAEVTLNWMFNILLLELSGFLTTSLHMQLSGE